MEPDTVYVQVRNVHRAIATNAKLLGRDDLRAKDASLYRELVLHPAAALEDAVADSVLLHGRYGHLHEFAFMDPRFYGKQAKNVQLALDDNAQLQDMNDELEYVDEKPQPLKLSTMSDTFITELVESLSHIVRDNASVVSDQRVDTRPLKTSQPQYQVRLVSSLQNLLDAHIGLKSNTKVHEDPHHVTEGTVETLKQENRRLAESIAQYKSALAAADKEKAQVKAQYDLQVRQAQVTKDALNAVQQENQRLAESAAQSSKHAIPRLL
ncbi:hypothetical protein K466DRAFT_124648 [Polyporus arcularius HHB13444]|uniref:Uncharacterized protein n=1 Tax=Polyporus arcularius HHB13444 TaxID=1314778 RepID=A0A5C3PD88_9APHY|nr:hypothetical protein K466DRAFT_124648 [Polyporus arcularius HHB13444]